MLCGHIFCLHPCLLPANSDQKVVQCPLCFIETDIIHLEAITQLRPPDISTPVDNAATKNPCYKAEPCQHSSQTVCPQCVGNYESELQLRDCHAVLSDSVCSSETEPPDSPTTEAKCSLTTSRKIEVNSELDRNRLFIGDLPVTIKHDDVQEYFAQFGPVNDVVILRPVDESSPRRCGFVGFHEWASVWKALVCHPHLLKGTPITVSLPRPKRMRNTVPASPPHKCLDIADVNSNGHSPYASIENATTQFSSQLIELDGWLQPKTTESHLTSYFDRFGPARLKRKPNPDSDRYSIFIGDLPVAIKHYDVLEYFSQFGPVDDVNLLRPTNEPTPRRCGFVGLRDWASVRKAVLFHPHLLKGTHITVSLPRTKRMRFNEPELPDGRIADLTDVSSKDPFKCTTITFSDQVKLFVGRLHPKTTESELATYFSQFGYVEDAQIITNKKNASSGNFGFVNFTEIRTINRDVLNTHHFLHGRMLNVQIATTTGERKAKHLKAVYDGNVSEEKTSHIFSRPSLYSPNSRASRDLSPVQLHRRSPSPAYPAQSGYVRENDFGTLVDIEAARCRHLRRPSIPEGPFPHASSALGVQRPRRLPTESCEMTKRAGSHFRNLGLPHCQQRMFNRRLPSGESLTLSRCHSPQSSDFDHY